MKVPPAAVLERVSELYERGLTLQALREATAFAPLEDWEGVAACCLAARIATNAGGGRLAMRLAARMWRLDRTHPLSQFEYGFHLLQWRGPLAFWLSARNWPAMVGGTQEDQGEVLALRASTAIDFRDFNTAEQILGQAEAIAPQGPWIKLQRAYLLERLEKVEEALEVAMAACKLHLHPVYRAGTQTIARLLQLLDRDSEAVELLQQADTSLENGQLSLQLYTLLANLEQWAAAEQALERYAALSPLLEPRANLWLQSQRARFAYHLGKRADAIRHARELKDTFNTEFSERLAKPVPVPERVRLEVPFVRQHFKTCAPATMAALGRYWNMPADHMAMVEAICYDGTPSWQQRDWAEQKGWVVREFRVTWESACALLSHGIPFAIGTVEATSAHMQAVMGFDRTRGTLLLRDPSQPFCLENYADAFFKAYRAFGPRGMIILPQAEASRLNGISLPESELYDQYHALTLALSRHERDKARAALSELEVRSPDEAITWEGRLALAAYDANSAEEIRCLDRLLELFPNNPARLLRRLWCMKESTREERIEFLERACAIPTADPALYVELARNLMADAPKQAAAERWLARALRRRPLDPPVLNALADLRWWLGQFAEATELYRFAATVSGYQESNYQAWFVACRQVRQTDDALTHLKDRFERFGARSSQPALTLAWALRELERPEEARAVLSQAVQLRPDDGYLIIRAAALHARLGAKEQADTLLLSAKAKVRQSDWLRAAAEIADLRTDLRALLQFSREVLALEPLAIDAHGGVARALAQLEGSAAAVEHLKVSCARHPHHCGLQRLLIRRSGETGFENVTDPAREFLKISPGDAWARRELAWALANLGRFDEALIEAMEAQRIEPRNSASFGVLGGIEERCRRFPEAREHFRQAIVLSVDNSSAIAGLLRVVNTDKERKEELAFVERELIRQVVRGDGLLAFVESARPLLEPEALVSVLRQAHSERPDLWHVWSALDTQLDHLGRYEEALSLALQASQRFPHLPRVWLDVARVHRHRNDASAEIAAAQRAFEISPGWNFGAIALAGALERHRSLPEAREVYERALQHAPADPQLRVQLATVLWRLRDSEGAMASVERALRLAPGNDWAWNYLITWSQAAGQPARAVEFARELTRERPGEIYGWLMLAKVLPGAPLLPERLTAVDRVLALNPLCFEAWDFKAQLLSDGLDFDAALEVCKKGLEVCVANSYFIRGRQAWIEAQRGKVPEAITRMRSVLADNTGYAWGWRQLVGWLMGQKAFIDAETAIQQLLRLHPQDSWAQRQLAQVRLQRGDKAGASKVFSAVLDASPTDQFAAHSLFQLQLDTGDTAGAGQTLGRMQTHQPGAHTLAFEVRLRLRTGEKSAALEVFKTICAQPDPNGWPVQSAVDSLIKAGMRRPALKVLKRALKADTCNPEVGPRAVRLLLDQKQTYRAVWLFRRVRSLEGQSRAAAVLAHGLGQLGARLPFRIAMRCRREAFIKDDAAWGHTGYALARFKRMRAVANWLADWRSRTGVEPWMLFNLCFALRQIGEYQKSTEVAEYAVQKWGYRKENGSDLRLFLAVEDALAGSLDTAAEHLKRAHVRPNTPYDQQLVAIAKALVAFQRAPVEDRREKFKAIQRELNRVFPASKTLQAARDVRRTLSRAGDVFMENGAGARANIWFLWKLNWQWSFVAVAPVLLAIALSTPAPVFIAIVAGTLVRLTTRGRRFKRQ